MIEMLGTANPAVFMRLANRRLGGRKKRDIWWLATGGSGIGKSRIIDDGETD